MADARSKRARTTIAEYLREEEHRTIKHEYLRGEVYAMSGGTRRHSLLAANVIAHFHGAARGQPCRVYTSDFKVQPSDEAVYYPDVSVVCEHIDGSAILTAAPCLVVEVTSRGTVRIDRGEKLEQYRRCSTLRAYLIVDQFRRRVTRHWRSPSGDWAVEEYVDFGSIPVPCPPMNLTLDQIYEDVELPPLQVGESEPELDADGYVIER